MKWLPFLLPGLLAVAAVPALAQSPARDVNYCVGVSPGDVAPTVDMWFYEQELQRYENPKNAVRRKAEERAVQRRARLAAQRWFGFSPTRPPASSDPIHGDYSPTWTGRGHYPFRWSQSGPAVIVVQRDESTALR